MARTNKVRYSGVGVFANGYILSRVQNVSANTDLGQEEARELTNAEVVEYTSTNPSVSISIETNEYGSCRNIRAIAGVTGGKSHAPLSNITITSFDSSTTDIGIQVAEDGILARTCLINDAYLSSLSWNYDVGGVATESFNFDADNKNWFSGAYRQAYSVNAVTGSARINSSTGSGYAFFAIPGTTAGISVIRVYSDGILVNTGNTGVGWLPWQIITSSFCGVTGVQIGWKDPTLITTGTRYRAFIYCSGFTTADIRDKTSTSTIGSIPRGKLSIYLNTGETFDYTAGTNYLKLQSVSISVDLAREALNELGHYRSFEKSLTYPVPINVTFSTIASDLTDWAKFAGKIYGTDLPTGYDIGGFLKNTTLHVGIYNVQDTSTAARTLMKAVMVTGLQIISESFGVDVGGNATQDFTAKGSWFVVSGEGTPGLYPLISGVGNLVTGWGAAPSD